MDLDGFKELFGLEDDDRYDNQITAVLARAAEQPDENVRFWYTLCLLERIMPEIVATTESWSIGVIEGVSEKYKLADGFTFCELYQEAKDEYNDSVKGPRIAHGARGSRNTITHF